MQLLQLFAERRQVEGEVLARLDRDETQIKEEGEAALRDLAAARDEAVSALDVAFEQERRFARLATAAAKYWVCKRAPWVVSECLECLGGNGYVEESVLPRLYPEMLARAYAHQDSGELIYILTAASQEMADLLAHVLAFDGGLGSRSEIVDGRYTGRPAGPFNYREGKVLSMREVAEREGIDLSSSYAYSDSESDLPMLRAVGHAVVVNPDQDLRRIAAEEGWEVLHLDRLGRRLKVLAAIGAGTALASLGRVVRERSYARERRGR